jgi:hypothetical protein
MRSKGSDVRGRPMPAAHHDLFRPLDRRGVTRRETLLAFLLLAALGGAAAQRLAYSRSNAAEISCEWNARMINNTVEKWRFDKGRWPAGDLRDIGRDREYFPAGVPRCPLTAEPYRLDPATHRVRGHRH